MQHKECFWLEIDQVSDDDAIRGKKNTMCALNHSDSVCVGRAVFLPALYDHREVSSFTSAADMFWRRAQTHAAYISVNTFCPSASSAPDMNTQYSSSGICLCSFLSESKEDNMVWKA